MAIEIVECKPDFLPTYAQIPIRFEVRSVLRVEGTSSGFGGFLLREEGLSEPYTKDYDAVEGERPTRWAERFDLSNWTVFAAYRNGLLAGGAVAAMDTPEVHILDARKDLTVLWDIRVAPDQRNRGVGTALFWQAAEWARDHSCTQLKVETTNDNVPACRFYRKNGCRLGGINPFAYAGSPEVADDVQLLWYLDL